MQDWLNILDKKIRISICITDLKQDLDDADPTQRAEILALAQYLRSEILEPAGIWHACFEFPLDCDHGTITRHLEQVARTRNRIRESLRNSARSLQNARSDKIETSLRQSQNLICALELWYCTIGARLVPEKQKLVAEVWEQLVDSRVYLHHAIHAAYKGAVLTEQLAGITVDRNPIRISENEWLRNCDFFPTGFNLRMRCYASVSQAHEENSSC